MPMVGQDRQMHQGGEPDEQGQNVNNMDNYEGRSWYEEQLRSSCEQWGRRSYDTEMKDYGGNSCYMNEENMNIW
eukprot:3840726-Heterocapsa_arctica.AAC.1